MSKKRKIIIIILSVIFIVAIVIAILAINGKKKLDFVLDVGKSMYEFNEKKGKWQCLH